AGPPDCRRAKSKGAEARLVGRQYDRFSPCLACQVSREVVRKCRCALIGIADGRTGIIHDDACRTDVNENPRPRILGRYQKPAGPSTLVWKNGSRGPENRNKAAACTTASTGGSDSGAVLSRSASTGDAPNARSFAWDADERVRANT